jgi:hypothetical protein
MRFTSCLILKLLAALAVAIPLAGEARSQDEPPAATSDSPPSPTSESSESPAASEATPDGGPTVAIVVGAAGEPTYEPRFESWASLWRETAGRSRGRVVRLDAPGEAGAEAADSPASDRTRLETFLADESADAPQSLWLVLIGHGTFDGQTSKFNMKGPDISAQELAGWLERFSRPIVIINCTSSSSPFINELSGPGRVIVTATRSGWEMNYARFGEFFAAAVGDPAADLDKDHQTSVLEAFLKASADVAEFYKTESRLATEHSLIDDNGDGLGTQHDWFRGVRAILTPAGGESIDGTTAHQIHLIPSPEEQRMPSELREFRDFLEHEIIALREAKSLWDEEAYYEQFEYLAVALANVYQWQNAPAGSPPEPPPIDWWILGE